MNAPRPSGEPPRLPRFRVVRELGGGAQGSVHEAMDLERGLPVALKTLRMLGAEEIARFKVEFRAVRDLRHPNLVSLGDLIEDAGRWFFTMELVRGRDFLAHVRADGAGALDDSTSWPAQAQAHARAALPSVDTASTRIDAPRSRGRLAPSAALEEAPPPASPPLPEEDPARWSEAGPRFDEARLRDAFRQLATGLEFLHGAGKVHRDLKPSNVLVEATGRVVLIDFGVVAEATAGDEDEIQIIGTVPYMAPEQALGEAVGPAADWYAAGVLLFEALSGRRPFDGPAADVIADKCALDPPRIFDVAPSVPDDLGGLCMRLLARDAEMRPTGAEVLGALGVDVIRPAVPAGLTASPPPFVGRRGELDDLSAAFRAMTAGAAVSVLVEGESGVGKSALTRQFLEGLRTTARKVVILEGRCHEQERVPYNAFDAVIDALARYVRARSRATREQLLPPGTGRLLKLFPTLGVIDEVAARANESLHPRAEARADREGAFAVLRELLRRVAQRRPTVVVLDDVQWADTDSLALLDQLTAGPDAPPLLYVATARRRPDGTSCAARGAMHGDVRVVSLAGLEEADANALLDRLLAQRSRAPAHGRGTAASIDRSQVVASTHGHPMFIEEMVRYLAQPREDAGAVALDDALFARVTELAEDAKRLLALVAAAGMPVAHAVVAEAAKLSPGAYAEHVATLRDARLVRVRGERQEDAIEPYHDRVREAVLARTGDRERASLHGRLGAVFEARGGGAELLFHHFAAAGDGARATRYAEIAAEAAASALAFERSAALYRSALSFGATDPARKRRLLTALGERLTDAGRAREAAETFARAAAVTPIDPRDRLELERRAAEQFLMGGHLHEGLAATRDVLNAFDLSLPARRLVALARVGWYQLRLSRRALTWTARGPEDVEARTATRLDVCWSVGAGLGMVDSVRSMIFVYLGALLALDHGDEARIARALAAAAMADAGLGRRAEATRLHEACLRAGASEGSERTLFYGALAGVAHAFFLDNDWERALAGTRQAHRLWESTGRTEGWESDIAEQFACWCLDNSGRFAELKERVPARIRAAQRSGNRFIEVSFRTQFVNLRLLGDRPDEARADVEDAIGSWLRDSGDFGNQEYLALRSLSYIALYAGDLEAAERLLPQWDRYFASLMGRVVFLRQDALMFIGSIALARAIAARSRGDEGTFRRRLREAKRAARDVLGITLPMARSHALHLRAGICAVEGDTEGALATFREALGYAEGRKISLDVACLRVRMATLLDARDARDVAAHAEARELRGAAERWFDAQGAVAPARLLAVVLPGFPHPG